MTKGKVKVMKKKITCLVMVLVLAVSMLVPVTCFASGIKVTLNGEQIYFDQPPIIRNGRTLVPVRAIFEAMGCTVLWDGANQIVNVATEFGMMTLGIGSNYISYRNENEDRSIFTDVPPQIINMRTLVPVRAIAECTGYKVDWDDASQTVVITGEMAGITLPNANIPGYYSGTTIPDCGACLGTALTKQENGTYTYNGITGKQVIEYIETYLASAGFLIDSESELFGAFIFVLSNEKTQETVRISYYKADKLMYVTCSQG